MQPIAAAVRGSWEERTSVCLQLDNNAGSDRPDSHSDAGARDRQMRGRLRRVTIRRIGWRGNVINGLLEPDLVLIGANPTQERRGARSTLQKI